MVKMDRGNIWLWVLVGSGLILRLQQLDAALWYDEAFSAWLASLPPYNIIIATIYDVHPPTYYLLLWVITHLFGNSEMVLRLPSVLAGTALIWLVYRLACDLSMSHKAALLAAGLVTIAPYQVYYSQEARFYMLQSLFLTVATIGLVERRDWLLVGGSLAAIYLHNVSLVFVICLFGAGWVWEHLKVKRLLNAGAIILLGYLPLAGLSILQAQAVGRGYWIPPLYNPPGRILSTLDDLIFLMPNAPFVVSGLVTSLLLIMIFASIPRALKTVGYTPIFLYLLFFLPLAALTFISLLWQPIILARVVAPLAPAYYLLIAWSVTATRRRVIVAFASAGPVVIVILAGYLTGSFGRGPVDQNYVSLFGQFRPGDAVFHINPGSYVPFHYYRPDIPQYVWQQNGDLSETLRSETKAAMKMQQGDLADLACKYNRWWVIKFNNPVSPRAEIDYTNRITRQYHAQKSALLRQDITVEAWLYLIIPNCERSQHGKAQERMVMEESHQTL